MDPGAVLFSGSDTKPTQGAASGVSRLGPPSADERGGRLRVDNLPQMAAAFAIQDGPNRTTVVHGNAVLLVVAADDDDDDEEEKERNEDEEDEGRGGDEDEDE